MEKNFVCSGNEEKTIKHQLPLILSNNEKMNNFCPTIRYELPNTIIEKIEMALDKILTNECDVNILFKREREQSIHHGPALDKCITLLRSADKLDHLVFYKDKHHITFNKFLFKIIYCNSETIALHNEKYFVHALFLHLKKKFNFQMELNVKNFKNVLKTYQSRKRKLLSENHIVINKKKENVLDKPLAICSKITTPRQFVHEIIDIEGCYWPTLKTKHIELYYYLKQNCNDFNETKIIDRDDFETTLDRIILFFEQNTTINGSWKDKHHLALSFIFQHFQTGYEFQDIKQVTIESNGIYKFNEGLNIIYYYKIGGNTFSKSNCLKDVLIDWITINSICPKMKMHHNDKGIYQCIGAFSYQDSKKFCKNMSEPLQIIHIIKKIIN